MTTVIISILVPVLIFTFLPKLLENLGHKPANKKLLAAACLVYLVSWYLPTFHIEGQNTAFVTHFVGGGIFSGLLWLYLVQSLKLKLHPPAELVSLYFLVSGLGVANELLEFFLDKTGLMYIPSWDTWWDLLANTSGAITFWLVYKITYAR